MSGGIVERIDHFVLTVRDLAAACDFYSRVLGAEIVPGTKGPTAALFGRWKINLHARPPASRREAAISASSRRGRSMR
ncbi:MAG TPA: VOC family protein, partial [Stellaceae bacterium]|nr:VOC family protein [Stellaceae bacterium]